MPLVRRNFEAGEQGRTVVGCVQLVNKHSREGFGEADESSLAKLCHQLYTSTVAFRSLQTARRHAAGAHGGPCRVPRGPRAPRGHAAARARTQRRYYSHIATHRATRECCARAAPRT